MTVSPEHLFWASCDVAHVCLSIAMLCVDMLCWLWHTMHMMQSCLCDTCSHASLNSCITHTGLMCATWRTCRRWHLAVRDTGVVAPFENAHASKLVRVSDRHDEHILWIMIQNDHVEIEVYLSIMIRAEPANVQTNCSQLQVSIKYVQWHWAFRVSACGTRVSLPQSTCGARDQIVYCLVHQQISDSFNKNGC